MPKEQSRVCPFCESKKRKLLYTQKYSGYFTHKIVQCLSCGFVFVGNTPPQSFYDKYYRDESKYEGVRQHEAHEDSTYELVWKFAKKHLDKSSSVLDIGCSTGSLLAFLKEKGYSNLYGIDPAPACRKVAKEKYGIKVDTYYIEDLKPKKKYDFIILSQVLEHLIDIKGAISKIHSLLREGGYLFIGIPDAGRFHINFEEPFGEFSTEHINFFTEKSLGPFMLGFTNVQFKSSGSALFSFWQRDDESDLNLKTYIELSKKKQVHLQKIIGTLPGEIAVWGVGALTRRLLVMTNLSKKAKIFVDSNPKMIGSKIGKMVVKSPESLKGVKYPILISSYKFKDEIRKTIKAKGLINKVYVV